MPGRAGASWVKSGSSKTFGVKWAPASWRRKHHLGLRAQQGPSKMFQKHPVEKVLALSLCSESPSQQPRKEVHLFCLSSQTFDFAKRASKEEETRKRKPDPPSSGREKSFRGTKAGWMNKILPGCLISHGSYTLWLHDRPGPKNWVRKWACQPLSQWQRKIYPWINFKGTEGNKNMVACLTFLCCALWKE